MTEQIRNVCRSGRDLLFRYGGDEFLLLFEKVTRGKAEERIEQLNERLCSISGQNGFSYPLSLSYGVVEGTAYTDWKELIRAADRKMYIQKQEKKMARDL